MPMLLATLIMLESSLGLIMDMDMLLDMELLVTEDTLGTDIMDIPAMAMDTMGKEKLTLMPSQMLMPTHSARSTMVCQYIMLTPLDTLTMLELSLVSITGMDVYLGMELLGTEVILVMGTLAMLIMDTMDIMANVKLTLMPSLMPIPLPRSTMGSLYTMHMPLDIHTMLGL